MTHFNKLTPAEHERLSYLMEECAEVIHIIGKIMRHGYNSYDPTNSTRINNRKLLEKELADVNTAVKFMDKHKDISIKDIQEQTKNPNFRYWHYNTE